jgi:iron complex transport system ATP-binding protein
VIDVLNVSGLSFAYGDKEIFSDLSFSLRAGEILCLMGPNGCGKTTLLDNIMAIRRPGSGIIELMGKPLKTYKRHQIARHIAYVPQIHDITFPYTAKEIVLMGRTAYTGVFGEPKPEDEEIALDALAKVGIRHFADTPYSRLSGGELKLALLARALGQRAALIIMDEPTAHLDFKNELMFLETISELSSKENIAVLIATHSPAHAFYFDARGLDCRAAMMARGAIVAEGRPDDVVTVHHIEEVYGVKAGITLDQRDGMAMKTVTLFGTA